MEASTERLNFSWDTLRYQLDPPGKKGIHYPVRIF